MKKIKISKNNICKNLKRIEQFLNKHFFSHFKDMPLFSYFIVTALLNTLLLRVITVGNFLYVKPLFFDLGMLFIFASFVYLFRTEKKRKKYLVVLSFVTTIICIIHSAYYTYYDSFASVSLLATSTFVVDVGDAVVEQVLRVSDLLYLWQPFFMLYLYNRDSKIQKEKAKTGVLSKNKSILKVPFWKNVSFIDIFVSGIVVMLFMSLFMTSTEWSRFGKMWNRESVVSSFGIYTYQVNDIVQSLEPKINNLFGHDKALKKVVDYYEERGDVEEASNDYTGIFEGKNVLVIHAESLQTMALNHSFNGVEVTPTLNRLIKEGIYFSNYYSQVGVGTSSDAEFTFSSSLMPSSNGTVFVNYFDREYNTIQKAFKDKGYYTFSMHGNTGDFWNRSTMHQNMGYDKFYSKSSFEIDETIGLGISDKSFFKQVVPMIKELDEEQDKPFYGTLITLTNHTPWSDLELMDEYDTTMTVEIDGEQVVRDYLSGTTLGNYFRSVHYMDQALEQFLSDLDTEGLLDNMVIIIYGDHDSRISSKNYNLMYNYDPYTDSVKEEGDEGYIDYNEYEYRLDKNVPFIIWTKDNTYTEEVTTVTGMIDAYPIIENLFRLETNEFQLGHDILGLRSSDNTVVFTDGSYVTNKVYYNGQNGEIYPINGEVVDEDYIKNNAEYASDLIDVSNDIITYDLISEIQNKES